MKTRILAIALAAAMPLGALAQDAAPQPRQQDRRAAMHERMCADLDAHLAARLAWVEAKVGPAQAQRAAWDEFARASRDAAAPMRALCAAGAQPAARDDVVARLAERERRMSAMLETTRGMRAAVEKLLPTLDEAQRRLFAENYEGQRARALHGGHGMHHPHGQQRGQGG
ncbi:MAG: Spy/CpxP family protein refolding chaperone [Alphaproteobacteria bacterium]